MQFTNKLKIPKYLADWLVNDNYDHNNAEKTVSTTTIMKPVRVYWLTRRHEDSLEMDVSELVSSRLGSAIHDSIEKVETIGVTKEQRISKEVEIDGNKYTITGKFDILQFEDGKYTLRDIKTTSVWAYIFGGKDEDYCLQLSVYRWLLADKYKIEDTGCIDFIFTDWQATKAKTEENYPDQRIMPGYPIKLMSLEDTEAYVLKRISEFYAYENAEDNDLPECTPEELWAQPDSWAVKKKDAKRATKVCDTEEEALKYIEDRNLDAYVEYRRGKVKRCNYCSAAPFCNQFNQLNAQGLIDYF